MKKIVIILFIIFICSCSNNLKLKKTLIAEKKFFPREISCNLELVDGFVNLKKMIPVALFYAYSEKLVLGGLSGTVRGAKEYSTEEIIDIWRKEACQLGVDGFVDINNSKTSFSATAFKWRKK